MLNISTQLFSTLENREIIYCHWKSNEHLIEGLDGITDLDVLVDKNNRNECRTLLFKLKFLECKSQFGSRYPNVEDWIGFDSQTGKLIHLHLHYQIVTGHKGLKEYDLPWSDTVLKTRIKEPLTGVYVSDPNWEIITLYSRIALKATTKAIFHALRGNYVVPKDVQNEINYLKGKVDWNIVLKNLKQFYSDSSDVLLEIMYKEQLDSGAFRRLQKNVKKKMAKYNRYNCLPTILKRIFFQVIWPRFASIKNKVSSHVCRKTPSFGGFSIAFIGQDGSGKSTVTKDIEKWFRWKMDARRFYLGSGEHYISFLSKIKRYFIPSKKPEKVNHSSITNNSIKVNKRLSISTVLRGCINLQNIAKRALKVVKKASTYQKNGGIALFDRFPQNQFFGLYDGPKIRPYFFNKGYNSYAVEHLAKSEEQIIDEIQTFSPSIIFKLILPPEESIRRKPFENYEMVKQKSTITNKLQFTNSIVVEIDATDSYEHELLQVKQYIWNYMIKQQHKALK